MGFLQHEFSRRVICTVSFRSTHWLNKASWAGSFIAVLSRAFNVPLYTVGLQEEEDVYTVSLTYLATDPFSWNTVWEMLSWRTSQVFILKSGTGESGWGCLGHVAECRVPGPQGSCLSHLAPLDLSGPGFLQSCSPQASGTTGPVRKQVGSWGLCVSVHVCAWQRGRWYMT